WSGINPCASGVPAYHFSHNKFPKKPEYISNPRVRPFDCFTRPPFFIYHSLHRSTDLPLIYFIFYPSFFEIS
ncbi:hypothetical protein K435DRAFT_785567, partial [Dendrothele bispora CBS 962.96]